MNEKVKDGENTPKRTISDVIADVRNGAVILAALVFSFHWATQGDLADPKPAGSISQTIEIEPVAVPAAHPQKSPTTDSSGSSEIVASQKITEALSARIEELKNSKPVILKSVAAVRETQARRAPVAQAYAQSTVVQPTTVTPPNGQAAIPKLGFAPDGSALSAEETSAQIKTMLSKIPEDYTINWKAENEKVNLYVFTDPTCPYCKKLHHSIPELNAAGVSVHYFLFPRDLPSSTAERLSPAGQQVSNIWCSVDQKAAFDEAFDGFRVKDTFCGDLPDGMQRIAPPLSDHYFLGNLVGINGTPTFLTDHGVKGEGFSTTAKLLEKILP